MLQQTQVDRVLPKYHEWLRKYPSFSVLAEAPPAEVSQTWRPLGYNIRPKRLQSIAQQAVEKYDGKLPSDHDDAAVVQGHRRIHRRRDSQLRVPRARRDPRHQRRARAVPDLRRQGRSEEPRDEEAPVGAVGGGAAAQARVRLQPGADGFRRHALQRAQAEVPGVFDEGLLPISCADDADRGRLRETAATPARLERPSASPAPSSASARPPARSDRRTARRSSPDTRA